MATTDLINPIHSDTRSPTTDSRPPQRRTALYRQQLSLDIPDQGRGLLSSSLPSPISKKQLSFLKSVHQNEKNKRQKLKESVSVSMDGEAGDVERDELPPRSNSLSTNEQSRMRPRSASLFSPERGGEGSSLKRKSLKGLSRSRPSSARLGRSRSRSRADSFKPDETCMEQVEQIMANIKTQLTQFSEEDLALQERLNNLTEGINLLITSHCRKLRPAPLNPIRSVSSGTPRKPGKAVHWKDIELNTDKTSSSAPSSESNLLSLPTVTISSSSSDTNVLTNLDCDEDVLNSQNVGLVRHKILKVGGMDYCSSNTSPPPPICTIVIEDSDGQIHCPTPSSLVDDEVFVL